MIFIYKNEKILKFNNNIIIKLIFIGFMESKRGSYQGNQSC